MDIYTIIYVMPRVPLSLTLSLSLTHTHILLHFGESTDRANGVVLRRPLQPPSGRPSSRARQVLTQGHLQPGDNIENDVVRVSD